MKYGWRPDEYLPVKKGVRKDFKAEWNWPANGGIADDMLKDLPDKSYSLVLGGLSKKKQAEIFQ